MHDLYRIDRSIHAILIGTQNKVAVVYSIQDIILYSMCKFKRPPYFVFCNMPEKN